jgi:glycosyltransferase involved in cell wall biosynthesis
MNQSLMVSIIIPTYNNAYIVCDAIDCSLNQTYNNLEIIVVDDGSNDGTERLLKEKYGNRIRYIHQENKGLSAARNTGIRFAVGKYLQFLDADDLIDKNKISIQLKQLKNIQGVALAYCDYIRSDLSCLDNCYEDRMSPVLQKEKPFDDIMMKWETERSIPHHCFLFDSAIFKKYGIAYDEKLSNHEDWDLLMNVFALNPLVFFIDRRLANYRIRKGSICRNRKKMKKGYLQAINKQIQKYRLDKEVTKKLKIRKKEIKSFYREQSPCKIYIRAYQSGRGITHNFGPPKRATVSKRWPVIYKNDAAWELYHYGAVILCAYKVVWALIFSKNEQRILNVEKEIRDLGSRVEALRFYSEKLK